MSDHFSAFSFVDRITLLEPGRRARAVFAIPHDIPEFPRALVAEAVGQLAAWVAMSKIEFRGRPVAALADETRFHGVPRPGETLELAVDIDDCDDEAVAYGGSASIAGRLVTELEHCLGPMLPCADFDAPEALRERFALLCAEGARPGRFRGVSMQPAVHLAHEPGRSLTARVDVPLDAPFFADHFPRRAVFPATLMLDAQMCLALELAAETPASSAWTLRRMSKVKVRSFTLPGQSVELRAEAAAVEAGPLRVALSARYEGKIVSTARVEFEDGA
jgi:3-hydroxymyristoyl/3-hydroxydecanoyl-(acyl carrier protein) dehydratase